MENFLKKITSKASKGLKDFFTLTDAEKSQGKTPNIIEKTTGTIGEYLAPKPNKVRAIDVAREIPKETGKMAVDIAQSIPRAILSTALTVAPKKVKENIGEINPQEDFGTLGKVLLGDERIKTIPIMGQETLEGFGVSKEKAKKVGPFVGFALTGLDIYPGTAGKGKGIKKGIEAGAKEIAGQVAKKGVREIAKETIEKTPDEIINLVKNSAGKKVDLTEVAKDLGMEKEYKDAINTKTSQFIKEKGGFNMGEMLPGEKVETVETGAKEVTPKIAETILPKRVSKSVTEDIIKENFTDIPGIEPSKIKKVQLFGSSVEGKAMPGDIDTFITVADDAFKWKKLGGLPAPITFERGKFSYIVMPESESKNLLEAMLYTGRKDADRAYSGTAVNVPKRLWGPTQITERTLQEDGVKSIGEVMAEGARKGTDNIVKETIQKPDGLERKFITRTREMEPTIGPLLKGKYERKANQSLKDFADEVIKTDPERAKNIAMTETNDEAVAVASKLIEEYSQRARAATDALTKNDLYAQAAEIANEAARNLTESGRAIQAASLLGRMTPEGMARYAARKIQQYNEKAGQRTMQNFLGKSKKIPELTSEQLKDITETMTRINKMEDGIEKARELQKLSDKMAKMIPSTLYSKIINVWKAGLLTGLKTTGVNIASNLSHAISETAKDIPASMVDKITSLFTGERTLVLTNKGSIKGASEGVKKGWDYLKTGFDERNVANKLDYRKVNFGKGKVAQALDKYVSTVFGLLGAEDQPFYYTARARSLANQAAAQAKNQGLKGKAAVEYAQKLIENPTDDMVKYATLDAETAVFQNDSWLARKAQNLAKGIEIILPFSKTPANVANAMINYTPVGIVKTIIENIGKGRFDQRLFSQGIGRGITGTAGLAIGGELLNNKMMNLSFPTSEKERKQWELEGRQPNTILMGGKWRNVNVLGPLGMVLIIGGNLQKGINDTGSFTGGLAQAGAGAGSALTEQTFLSGVNTFIDAIKDPTRSFNGFASSLAGSIVPTLVADFARGIDKYERKTSTPGQRIVSRIPGVRENLQPKIDAFGKPIKTQSFLTIMLDASRPGNKTAPDNDPVAKEWRRLMDEGFPVTPTALGPNAGYKSLTDKENADMWKMAGRYSYEEVKKAMGERAYKRYDDEQKASYLDDIIQEAKVEARARVVKSAMENTPIAERKAKLAQMKDEKLLTQEVYSRYISLTRKK